MIDILDTDFADVKLIKRPIFLDTRGQFTELFNRTHFSMFLENGVAQTNLSVSNIGVVRGLHWQNAPFSQGKLISCLAGSVFDVVVDLRKSSANFGKHISINLDAITGHSIWIPPGFAHGFQSLESETKFLYFTSSNYSLENSMCINPLDVDLGIKWPIAPSIVSIADSNAPKLSEVSSTDLFD